MKAAAMLKAAKAIAETRVSKPSRIDKPATISKMQTDVTPGSLRQTGNPLDVALQGDGMFVVETQQGERYTRAGAFVTDAEGVLRTPDGHRVLGVPSDPAKRDRVEIRIPPGTREIGVGADGTVTADNESVGQLHVVRFDDPNALEKEGLTLFTQRAGNRTQAEDAQVVQGFLESGNVNAIAGMNELITVSRSFEAFQKVIDGFRNLDERTAREVGGR